MQEVLARLAELERRVDALEGRPAAAEPQGEGGGVLSYQGRTEEPRELQWQITVATEPVLELADEPRVEVLAALAHTARVAIVRQLARHGTQPGSALQEAAGLGSAGQFYHHLKALTGAGIVEADKRGSYRLKPAATIPVLVLLTASADIAGQLR
ncbi:ArsR/SmtB family transcription factor [Amycolatopsis aidingensis]|uniref:ArsR/SmtB family transcription factor n=1 Tax=Amycolatopsis aidingensis TaxID=2842453 RepID=UPI001C0CBA96|nr:helix-turn-helix transcriptional regulator [Amycolatopsis aidingensis]